MSSNSKKLNHLLKVMSLRRFDFKSAPIIAPMIGVLGRFLAGNFPSALRGHLNVALARWSCPLSNEQDVEGARIACWEFLNDRSKKGRRGAAEREEFAVRALIALLGAEFYEEQGISDLLEFFFEMLIAIDRDNPLIDDAIDGMIHALDQ